ncbi:HAD hydrolase-like protein [Synechococcus sp. AH-551-C10]|nr:HAD family hydrolase [Synechococcus sp. AH-551-C10]MDB4659642.1 HAD hydrolase-like protein [Synechococcus sp. AH-551-C10]
MKISHFKTLLFDCDGVVLNSNRIKTEAFRTVTLPYGKSASDALVAHHTANGGISRFKKFDYFVDEILPTKQSNYVVNDRLALKEKLLAEFAVYVKQALINCEVVEGISDLRKETISARWFIVSGGDQDELREVFNQLNLDHYFDGGIYGSPFTKFDIVEQLRHEGNLEFPALFIGDSRLDHQVADAFNLDFLFVSQWTEFEAWRTYCDDCDIKVVSDLKLLLTV